MLQEFIPGGDDFLWTLGAAIAADGEVLATFSGRKLRQTRTNMGSARVGEALWDEEVVDSGLALLAGAQVPRRGAGGVETRPARRARSS